MTYKLGLGILKEYVRTKNEVSRSRLSKVRARTGQTHGQTHRLTDATKSIYHAAFAGGQLYVTQNAQERADMYWLTTALPSIAIHNTVYQND